MEVALARLIGVTTDALDVPQTRLDRLQARRSPGPEGGARSAGDARLGLSPGMIGPTSGGPRSYTTCRRRSWWQKKTPSPTRRVGEGVSLARAYCVRVCTQ